jgi:uncharacterized membrane protein (UPF0127 family)
MADRWVSLPTKPVLRIFPLPLRLSPRKGERMRALTFALALLGLFAGPLRAAEQQSLEIVSKTGVHPFAIEVVSTPEDRAKGLMYRKSLPEGQGMLFDFHSDQDVSFWMQNTYIPLDMIFIKGDGRIANIVENAEPLSTKMIPSRGPVRGVLEVIGGTTRKLGIAAGDKVAHPIFSGR